jgi:3-hydroxyisobutyrate dehydrogenase-like beta-hydroxyacid dehydrogenase
MKVGFIGLGRMGRAMVRRILDGGHDVSIYNRTPEKAAEFSDSGARVAVTVSESCDDREVVITMVADDAALEAVTLGPGGVRDSLPAGAIHLAMGTHGVGPIRALRDAHAAAGQRFAAAPVLGRPEAVEAGELKIVAGGPADALEECAALFQELGRHTFQAGPLPESASAIKLANNFVLGCAIEVMGEAFSLVRKYDVVPDVFYEVMTDGLFSAPAYKTYGRIIVEEDYDRVGFTAELGLKDANLILRAADLARLPLPSANAWRDRLLGAIARGDGERDWAVVALEQWRAGGAS